MSASRLFNRLTRSRRAVADQPGLHPRPSLRPRPRRRAATHRGRHRRLRPPWPGTASSEMARQAEQAIAETDVLLFVVDGRQGSPATRTSPRLRRSRAPGAVASIRPRACRAGAPIPLAAPTSTSAARRRRAIRGRAGPFFAGFRGDGVESGTVQYIRLIVLDALPGRRRADGDADSATTRAGPKAPAIVGSSARTSANPRLMNLARRRRVIAFDMPGHARRHRDPVRARWQSARPDRHRRPAPPRQGLRGGRSSRSSRPCRPSGTATSRAGARRRAGRRRPGRPHRRFALEAGARWWSRSTSGTRSTTHRRDVKADIDHKLPFLAFARLHQISASRGEGIVGCCARSMPPTPRRRQLATRWLTRALQQAVGPERHRATGLAA